MEEIGVVVDQKVGSISWNYEDIKQRLTQELEVYKKTVYTDDTIKTAKTDVASLRKLSKDIEDRRKEIRNKCLEPYELIEAQAKELVKLIDEPIKAINSQVEDYEKRRRERVRKEIEAFYEKESASLPEDLRQKVHDKIYDPRWENATTSKKTWKEGVQRGIQGVHIDLQTIKDMGSDFEEDMIIAYKKSLSLQEAIARMTALTEQRNRVIELEKQKEESQITTEKAPTEEAPTDTEQPVQEIAEPKDETMPKSEEAHPEPVNKQEREVITLFGTREQIEKVKRFIEWIDAKWQEGAVNEFFG